MNSDDNVLLNYYMLGFKDEINGTSSVIDDINEPICLKAYNLGAFHAIAGDDQTSLDYLTSEEILERIKKYIIF